MLRRCLVVSALLHAALLWDQPRLRLFGSALSFPGELSLVQRLSVRLSPPLVAPEAALDGRSTVPLVAAHGFRKLEPRSRQAAKKSPRPVSTVAISQAVPTMVQPADFPTPQRSEPHPRSTEVEQAYRLEIARRLRSRWVYPSQAKARGLEGAVELALAFGASGKPTVHLAKSSGHAVLDDEALRMVSEVAGDTSLLSGWSQGQLPLSLLVEFRLPAADRWP